jgi:signal transduction histidine kinase
VLKSELKEVQQYIRNLSHQLAKPQYTNFDLPGLIQEQKYWTSNENIDFIFDFDSKINWAKVPEQHQNEMYRIVQESISNTFKHANANKITIRIKNKNNKIYLEVADNGNGINKNSTRGMGIINMTERAKIIGADLNIHSEYYKGTKIILKYSLS